MGILSVLRRDQQPTQDIARAVRDSKRIAKQREEMAQRGKKSSLVSDSGPSATAAENNSAAGGGALETMMRTLRDIGLDGRLTFASAEKVAKKAQRGRGRKEARAIKRIIAKHRRGVTVGGFVTGLGGFATLAAMMPVNIAEFYIQATRMVGAIATVRGYDLNDDEVRTRVLASLVGEESEELLSSVGLGPVAGYAGKRIMKSLPATQKNQLTRAIGGRILRRFGLRSARLFGKSIPLLGGVIGALGDRRQLSKIAQAADHAFPAI